MLSLVEVFLGLQHLNPDVLKLDEAKVAVKRKTYKAGSLKRGLILDYKT
jgi:hypothetical protein